MTEPPIDRALVQELAALARLQVPPEREAAVAARLGAVLAAFAALREVDTAGVEASPYPLPLDLRWRPDAAGGELPREVVLQNASRTAAGAFLVPRAVDA